MEKITLVELIEVVIPKACSRCARPFNQASTIFYNKDDGTGICTSCKPFIDAEATKEETDAPAAPKADPPLTMPEAGPTFTSPMPGMDETPGDEAVGEEEVSTEPAAVGDAEGDDSVGPDTVPAKEPSHPSLSGSGYANAKAPDPSATDYKEPLDDEDGPHF